MAVWVAHAVGLGVSVMVGVLVTVGVFVSVAVSVGVLVGSGVSVPVGVLVGVEVLVAVLVAVAVLVGVAVASASGAFACPRTPGGTGTLNGRLWLVRAWAATTPAPAARSARAIPPSARTSRIMIAGNGSLAANLRVCSLTTPSLSLTRPAIGIATMPALPTFEPHLEIYNL